MATTAAVVISAEVAKALLGLYFQYMNQAGLTAEEGEKLYLETRLAFLNRDPSKIPDL
jgi:hypothetical protein